MKKIFAASVFAIVCAALSGGAVHASEFIKMRLAGQGTFLLSEETHTLYMKGDDNDQIYIMPYQGQDKFGNDLFLSQDGTQTILFNSNDKAQFIYMAGVDMVTAKKNFEFKLDKRYVETVDLK